MARVWPETGSEPGSEADATVTVVVVGARNTVSESEPVELA